MRCVLKDSSSRARALARQRDTEISRNALLGISFYAEECQTHSAGFLSKCLFVLFLRFPLLYTLFKDAKGVEFGILVALPCRFPYMCIRSALTISVAVSRTAFICRIHSIWSVALSVSVIPSFSASSFTCRKNISSA